MQKTTFPPPGLARDVTGEHASKAGRVLAAVARTLATENPQGPVDAMTFAVLVGSRAYDQAGRSCHGGGQNVSRLALRAVAERIGLERGDVPAGATREEFAVEVAQAARTLGYDWSDEDNQPAIPRHPVPGPRRSDESGRIPGPRPEQAVTL
ncbi:hypothetical protein [Streptomyces sp. AD55]|uniref:hypothetical protein n=1 Tax=Streptomyces sp. AD55 TaxID=3242895 RepID=UPI003529825F